MKCDKCDGTGKTYIYTRTKIVDGIESSIERFTDPANWIKKGLDTPNVRRIKIDFGIIVYAWYRS